MDAKGVAKDNQVALAARPWIEPGYVFRPVSVHDKRLHRLRREYPYFGYVEVKIEGVAPFVLFSNNDDLVAQTYFWFGANAFESLSMLVWRRMVRGSTAVVDAGAYTGVYSVMAGIVNPNAEIHTFEPVPRNFGRLLDNLVVNRLGTRVKAHEIALSRSSGTAHINLVRGPLTMSTGSSLEHRGEQEVHERRDVTTARLREVVDGFDCAKIDVEGHEEAVIEGMDPSMIADLRPDLLIELFDPERLRNLLRHLPGYSFAVIDDTTMTFEVNDFSLFVGGARNVLLRHGSSTALSAFCEPLSRAL